MPSFKERVEVCCFMCSLGSVAYIQQCLEHCAAFIKITESRRLPLRHLEQVFSVFPLSSVYSLWW